MLASIAVISVAGSPILAATDALCKANCISEKNREAAKHLCCPAMQKQTAAAQKLVRSCSNCFERQTTPLERAQIQISNTEPVSVSELAVSETRDRIKVNQKSLKLYSKPVIQFVSIPISLHRILV